MDLTNHLLLKLWQPENVIETHTQIITIYVTNLVLLHKLYDKFQYFQ